MTENNAKFKELNRKLGYMSPKHPDYAKTVAEIAKINETSVNFRDDNKKLLNIRNTIKDLDVQEISKGQTPGQKMMYSDILTGNKENFQNIDGKLYWVNPTIEDENDPNKKISIESINANGPTMTDDAAFDQHYKLMSAVKKTKAEDLSDQDLNYQVNNMFKGIGNDGIKSLIFDSENSDMEGDNMVAYSSNGMMFNTSEWFESYYNDLGISPQSEEAQRIRLAVQNNGVMHSENGIRVKEHFRDWYSDKLKNVEKVGDGKPTENKNTLNEAPGDDLELKEDLKVELPDTDSDNNYAGQTGTGVNRFSNSPFSGLTQYGWDAVDDINSDDILFNYGDGDLVVNTLTENYGKYGFTFKEGGIIEDKLTVVYENPNDPDDPKNGKEITVEFDNDRAKPLNNLNITLYGAADKDEGEARRLKEWMETMINWSAPKQ